MTRSIFSPVLRPALFKSALIVGAIGLSTFAAAADKYHVTATEKAACAADAMRFCLDTYPDADKLLGCMKRNHESLTAVCRIAFDAGVKRRRL